ncbi:MAG TPA: carbohydrate ABC transporter permease, partial [Lachnospiraceae bacterium]|nr:carbohydrate ABC transporter permease [Lachnospiraceae bacterium]
MTKNERKFSVKSVILNIVVIVLGLCYLFPIYIILVNSFKTRSELYDNVLALPKAFSFEFYEKAMDKMNFLRAFGNSLFVTLVSVLFIIVLSSMCAWMMVRSGNTFSKFLFSVFVSTMLIPFQTLMMPLMQELGWIRDSLHIPVMDTLGG